MKQWIVLSAFLGLISFGEKTFCKPDLSQAGPEDITNENFPDLVESFDYPNAKLEEVVQAISKLTGKNFIIDGKGVAGRISIIAPSQITVAEAYRAFLSALAMNNLTVVPSGKFLKIRRSNDALKDSIETYSGAYFPDTDQIITRIIKLRYINSDQIQKTINKLKSRDGNFESYEPTNSLILTDYGSNIERIVNILKELDVKGFEEQLEMIPLQNANARSVGRILRNIERAKRRGSFSYSRFRSRSSAKTDDKKSFARYIADDMRTNSIIVSGNRYQVNKVKNFLKQIDKPLENDKSGGVYVYPVKHGDAEKIAIVLESISRSAKAFLKEKERSSSSYGYGAPSSPYNSQDNMSSDTQMLSGAVKAKANKETNSLIIVANHKDYEVIKNILSQIDIPRDQVFLKSVFLEMKTSSSLNFGVSYLKFFEQNGQLSSLGRVGFNSGNVGKLLGANSLTEAGALGTLGIGNSYALNVFDLNTGLKSIANIPSLLGIVNFLKSNNGANVLSTPQIMALDNEKAQIKIGEQIPIPKESASASGFVSKSFEKEEVSLNLEFTPMINPASSEVTLKEVVQIANEVDKTNVPAQLQGEAIGTLVREIKTSIVIKDGDTAVLGGLMKDKIDNSEQKIPFLGDIPLLGWLFKGKNSEKQKQNLIVFLSPKIIRNSTDNSSLLSDKIDERIDFIQKNMYGIDPHGAVINSLPRLSDASDLRPELEEIDERQSPLLPINEDVIGTPEGSTLDTDFPIKDELNQGDDLEQEILSPPALDETPTNLSPSPEVPNKESLKKEKKKKQLEEKDIGLKLEDLKSSEGLDEIDEEEEELLKIEDELDSF